MARTAKLPGKIIELLKNEHMLSVTEISERLTQQGRSYNKTSVYRALDKLLESGEICKESFLENEATYELRSEHHDHAVCTSCETIMPIECSGHSSKAAEVGFQIDHHHTTFYGLCRKCV